MSLELRNFFNKQPRLGLLATADSQGKANAAYFGTPRMIDDKTVVIGLGKNRSFENLQQNPNAVFVIMEPGKAVTDWKGVRVYMKMNDCRTEGDTLNSIKAEVASMAGVEVAEMLHAAVVFTVEEVRPLTDFGQGWENSI